MIDRIYNQFSIISKRYKKHPFKEQAAMKGYLHVYTGDGKGKTTAALGLALRSVGAGNKVFVGQFVKGMVYSELTAIKQYFKHIEVRQYGRDCFIEKEPQSEDIARAQAGLLEMKSVLKQGDFDLVIMDEANIATYYNLYSVDELISAIKCRNPAVEVVVTGRKADPKLIKLADLVTEMQEIRHYYNNGIEARVGIEF